MKGILEKIKGASDRSVVIGIAVIVLLVIIFGVVRFTGGDKNDLNGVDVAFEDDSDSNVALVSESFGNIENNIVPIVSDYMIVKVPVLAGELFDMTDGKKRGCDNIVFVDREVSKSPAVLNATLKELFRFDSDLGFLPGNFVASREDLNFDSAIIENGVAKIYLTGEVGPLAGECDDPRLEIQVEEAALQFSTVNDVEIYLNGDLYETPTLEN